MVSLKIPLQERITDILSSAITNNRVANAYLFAGPPGVGKARVAQLFAQALNCLHKTADPVCECKNCTLLTKKSFVDFIEIRPDGSRIKVDQIRELKDATKFGPVIGSYLCVVIYNTENFTTEAANSFLKLLEEPPRNVVFILTASSTSSLLPTIISRCQVLEFPQLSPRVVSNILQTEYELSEQDAQRIVSVTQGELLLAELLRNKENNGWRYLEELDALSRKSVFDILKYVEELVNKEKENIKDIINLYIVYLVKRLKDINTPDQEKRTTRRCVQICLDTLQNMKSNINIRLHLETMMLSIATNAK